MGTFPMNVFMPTRAKGTLVSSRNNHSNIAAVIDPAYSGAVLVPGQAVKMLTTATGSIVTVTPVTSPNDEIYGFVIYSIRDSSFKGGDMVDVAIAEAEMIMEAAGAINAGSKVGINTSVQVVNGYDDSSGITLIGFIQEGASTEGQLVRVLIKTPHL